MICFKSAYYGFRLVVLTDNKLLTANIANALNLAWLEINVVSSTAVKTNSSAAYSLFDCFISNVDFNNLINVENELTCDNMITSPYFVIAEARARAMYHACNELKVPKQVLTAPDTIGTLTQNYDLGFSFPPCSWNIGSTKSGEINLLKDMLENISGRFCLIFSLAFAFQSGALEKLREKIINEKRLKAIVELPGGYVPNSNISCMAMFFDKTDENRRYSQGTGPDVFIKCPHSGRCRMLRTRTVLRDMR